MEIRCFNLGYMGTNCFLAWSEDKNAYLFDCGGKNLEALFDFVSRNELNMKYLIFDTWTWRSHRRCQQIYRTLS